LGKILNFQFSIPNSFHLKKREAPKREFQCLRFAILTVKGQSKIAPNYIYDKLSLFCEKAFLRVDVRTVIFCFFSEGLSLIFRLFVWHSRYRALSIMHLFFHAFFVNERLLKKNVSKTKSVKLNCFFLLWGGIWRTMCIKEESQAHAIT
jgi:hypothetical protein